MSDAYEVKRQLEAAKESLDYVEQGIDEMEEDASCMTREEWMTKHGETVVEVYDDVHRAIQGDLYEEDGGP